MGTPLSLMKGQFRNRKGGFSVATSFERAIKCWHMDRCTLHRHRPKACYVHVSRTMINHQYFNSLHPPIYGKIGDGLLAFFFFKYRWNFSSWGKPGKDFTFGALLDRVVTACLQWRLPLWRFSHLKKWKACDSFFWEHDPISMLEHTNILIYNI